jgi:hypothetical protein
MGARISEWIDRLVEKVKALAAPPMVPVPVVVTTHRPRR